MIIHKVFHQTSKLDDLRRVDARGKLVDNPWQSKLSGLGEQSGTNQFLQPPDFRWGEICRNLSPGWWPNLNQWCLFQGTAGNKDEHFYHPNCGFFMGINGTSQLFWLLAGFIWLRIVWNRSTWDDDEWPAYVSESSVTQSSSAFQECLTAFTIQIHSNVKLAQTISPWFLCWETLFSQLGGPSGMMVRFWSNHMLFMLFCCKKC